MRSDLTVEGTGNDIILLLFCQLDEIDGISGNSDRKLRIFFRMSLRIKQRFPRKHIDIEMVTAFCDIAVEQFHQIFYLLFIGINDPPYS